MRPIMFVYLLGCMFDAITDSFNHPSPEPTVLYDRMLGWARVAAKSWRPSITTGEAARTRYSA